LGVSVGVVGYTAIRAARAGLDWEAVERLDDRELERVVYGDRSPAGPGAPQPDPVQIHVELKRPGVSRELLHREYLERHPDGVGYTSFCNVYREWLGRQRATMRQEHRAGEKLFVDYSGKKPHIVEPTTGECIEVELFVAVLGASNFTFAEATRTQRSRDWIESHVRALEFFGGVPQLIVPDQLRSAVSRPCWYEPGVQRTYEELAEHYGTTVLPARPGKSRDKAKVEVGVQITQRWILARIRNQRFFSIEALNERIAELVDELNERTMRTYGASRLQLFDRLDRPALRPLPSTRFAHADWTTARVNLDYHIEFDHHYYSAPFTLIHEVLDVRATATSVELFLHRRRIASHARSHQRARHTTIAEHMPKAHQRHAEWTPARVLNWAAKVGPNVTTLVGAILEERKHPEHGYRSCLGILRLGKRFGEARLDAACRRAHEAGARSYRSVESILKRGLDRVPSTESSTASTTTVDHENIRGPDYYQ
jgi:transposase